MEVDLEMRATTTGPDQDWTLQGSTDINRGSGGGVVVHMPEPKRIPMQMKPVWANRKRTLWSTRLLDVILASFLVVILAVLFVGVAIAIKLDSKGPVLFRQKRYGLGGAPFEIFKFRSMTTMDAGDAEIVQAKPGDIRVTRVGSFIRRLSIDELPQIFNVLKGDMSLVGPRPHPMSLDDKYAPQIDCYTARYIARPGMTGLAQIRGYRGEFHTADDVRNRILHDVAFVRAQSLGLYLFILVRTVFTVFNQKEAY